MEEMPDDVVLAVLQHLDVKELFVCRLVCRRFGSLALHPDVWRHRSLSVYDDSASAVLRLAPCLQELHVDSRKRTRTLSVTTTRCAVKSLSIGLLQLDEHDALVYSLVIRNQESLGRLQMLEFFDVIEASLDGADILLRTVATCVGLQSLIIQGLHGLNTEHHVTVPHRPSLTNFHYPVEDDKSTSFVNMILTAHADTLEVVNLGECFEAYTCSDATYTMVRLLGAMPKLRSLQCGARIPGLDAVAACKSLREVTLLLYYNVDPTAIKGAAEFLRKATQLRKVTCYEYDNDEDWMIDPDLSAELIRGLISSKRPLLKWLSLECCTDVRPLAGGLPQLPGLCYLDVSGAWPDDELLLSITPATLPALRSLILTVPHGGCSHVWLHGDTVKALLKMNPLLHVHLVNVSLFNKCTGENCLTCALGCHIAVRSSHRIGLFSHAPDMCPSPGDHSILHVNTWFHM